MAPAFQYSNIPALTMLVRTVARLKWSGIAWFSDGMRTFTKNIVVISTEPILNFGQLGDNNSYYFTQWKNRFIFRYSRYHVITNVSLKRSKRFQFGMNVGKKERTNERTNEHLSLTNGTTSWWHLIDATHLHSTEVGMCVFSPAFGNDSRCCVSLFLVFFFYLSPPPHAVARIMSVLP